MVDTYTLYQRPGSPFWYVRLQDPRSPNGVRRESTKSRVRSQAKTYAIALQSRIDDELKRLMARTGLSISEGAEYYFEHGDLTPSTIKNHMSMLKIIMESSLGDFDMGSLRPEDIEAFIEERRKTKIVNTNRYVTDQTIRHYLSLMSGIYRFTHHKRVAGAPKVNPFKNIDRSFLDNTKATDRHLRKSVFQDILDLLSNPEHKRIILTLVGTGMRSSELRTLKIPQVDFLQGTIFLGYEEDTQTKTKRARDIPMFKSVSDTLLHQIEVVKSDPNHDPKGYVFPAEKLDQKGIRSYPRYSLNYLNALIKKKSGLSTYTNHRLRHSFASWMLQKDVDPITIKDLLGHRTLSTTTRYAHNISNSRADKIRKLDLLDQTQNPTHSIRLNDRTTEKPNDNKDIKKS